MAAAAKVALLQRLGTYRRAVASPIIFDRAPSEKTHNAQARIFRNGLSVIAFALLEDFLRSRATEVLDWLTRRRLDYAALPGSLRKAATGKTVRALAAHYDVRRRAGIDPAALLAEVGTSFVSLTSTETIFSPFALGWRSSNLSVDEVPEMLGAFGVKNGWGNIEAIARRAGFGFLVAEDSFKNAAVRRHEAAHQATAEIQPTDLQFFARDALGLALGYDAILCRSARLVAEGSSGTTPRNQLLADTVAIRFIERDGSSWREHLEGSANTIRRSQNYQSIESGARGRARARSQLLVVRDGYGNPYRWISTDVP